QPFAYPGGLVEIPMSPPSDVVAFRTGRWKLDWFLDAVGQALSHVIATGGVYDFLAHPSCLGVVDPGFKTLDLICDRVQKAGAEFVDLQGVAQRLRPGPPPYPSSRDESPWTITSPVPSVAGSCACPRKLPTGRCAVPVAPPRSAPTAGATPSRT